MGGFILRIYKNQQGFNLIELSIVLAIIGIILGGIIKGQELLESARLKSVLTQVNSYRLAVNIFYEKYDSLPGDFHLAQSQIDPSLKNGNNNGFIEGPGLAGSSSHYNHEALSFWSHLSAAGLISSVGLLPSNGIARFNQGAPSAKTGGGFTVQYKPTEDMDGHWFLLGTENGLHGNGGVLTPLQAMSLDKKADNGDPTSGRIRAKNGDGYPENACVHQGQYNVKNTEKCCILYFQF